MILYLLGGLRAVLISLPELSGAIHIKAYLRLQFLVFK